MTLPRKGSRLITVDGTVYRWAVRPKPTYSQGLGATMTFAVEPVRPAEVAEAVRAALEAGFGFTARPVPPSTRRARRPATARTK
jgi:hypothetical protein